MTLKKILIFHESRWKSRYYDIFHITPNFVYKMNSISQIFFWIIFFFIPYGTVREIPIQAKCKPCPPKSNQMQFKTPSQASYNPKQGKSTRYNYTCSSLSVLFNTGALSHRYSGTIVLGWH